METGESRSESPREPGNLPVGEPSGLHSEAVLDLIQPNILLLLRRSMAGVCREMLLAFNRFMVCSFTPRGLAWRFEALRTGRSLSEVVRRHNAIHPVEQVFLIHRESGLLLCDEGAKSKPARDPDMVSGMLTAIRDFVRDSFVGPDAGELHTIEVSGLTVYIESAPHAVLAGVMRGPATTEVRTVFRTALHRIHDRFSEQLGDFRGDVSPFAESRLTLRSCLSIESLGLNRRLAPITWFVTVLASALLAWGAAYAVFWNLRWESFIAELRQEFGVVILNTRRGWGTFSVAGLRDPMSVDPALRLEYYGLSPERVAMNWTLYHDLGAPFVVARARELLSPPETVSLYLRGNTLVFSGSAPAEWLRRLKEHAPETQGVRAFDISNVTVTDTDREARWTAYIEALRQEPGIVVLRAEHLTNGFAVAGLRDPLAEAPERILRERGPPASDVRADWHPYISLDPGLVLLRAKLALEPPATVRLSLDGATLTATGAAAHAWVVKAGSAARSIPGVTLFDTEKLQDNDMQNVISIADDIGRLRFDFLAGAPSLWPGQKDRLDHLTERIAALEKAAAIVGVHFTIEVAGYTNPGDSKATEQAESEDLSRRFLDMTAQDRTKRSLFVPIGMGAKEADIPAGERKPGHNRIVTLKVRLAQPQA